MGGGVWIVGCVFLSCFVGVLVLWEIYGMGIIVYHTIERVDSSGLDIETKVYVDLDDGVLLYQYLYRGPVVISTSCVCLPFGQFARLLVNVGAYLRDVTGAPGVGPGAGAGGSGSKVSNVLELLQGAAPPLDSPIDFGPGELVFDDDPVSDEPDGGPDFDHGDDFDADFDFGPDDFVSDGSDDDFGPIPDVSDGDDSGDEPLDDDSDGPDDDGGELDPDSDGDPGSDGPGSDGWGEDWGWGAFFNWDDKRC